MMVLYSGTTCPFSQRCRLVLFEKGMDFEIRDVDLFNKPEDISVMNPYGQVPILVERDLILYESNIINEYIDERFPHPQLMPADPLMRARARLFLFNFEKELFVHVHTLENEKAKATKRTTRRRARNPRPPDPAGAAVPEEQVHAGRRVLHAGRGIAPLLWRLDHYGIELSKTAAPLMKYAERIFSRPAYIEALTPSEKVMRR
jgi:RNA polymerase-associated protein